MKVSTGWERMQAAESVGHIPFEVGLSFPFHYTIMPSMRYNVRMTNNRQIHKLEIIVGEASVGENFFSQRQLQTLDKRWVKISQRIPVKSFSAIQRSARQL